MPSSWGHLLISSRRTRAVEGDDEMNHPLIRIQLGNLVSGADDSDLHGGWHTPQGTYPAVLASSELANQIPFSGRIFFAHSHEG